MTVTTQPLHIPFETSNYDYPFTINPDSGTLIISKPISAENLQTNEYVITVLATDKGLKSRSGSCTVTIRV